MSGVREAVELLKDLPVATIYEAAGKRGDMGPEIRPIAGGPRIAGIAFTLKTMPGDNLGVFRAIHAAAPGDVLVVDAGDTDKVTIWGGTSTLAASAKGLVGCVTNAAVRDVDEIAALRFPVYAAGISVRGAVKAHPGWLGEPVSVGGTIVNPGDVILADSDGVLVLPAARAAEIAAKAATRRQEEEARDQRLRAGEDILSVLGLQIGL